MTIDLAPYSSVFSLLDDVVKGAVTFEQAYNSPQMIAARKAHDEALAVQKMDDDLAAARKSGDFTQVDKDASG